MNATTCHHYRSFMIVIHSQSYPPLDPYFQWRSKYVDPIILVPSNFSFHHHFIFIFHPFQVHRLNAVVRALNPNVDRYGIYIGTMKTEKVENAYPAGVPGPCFQFLVHGVRVANLYLLLCMYYFSYFMFSVVFACFPCLVFVPGLHSVDFHQNLNSLYYSLVCSFFNNMYQGLNMELIL